jgi:hypothetical protein
MSDALTKPTFADLGPIFAGGPSVNVDDLPVQLTTPADARLAEHIIANYRHMRAEAVKTYAAMLKPINDRRNVILGWRRQDVEAMDEAVSRASAMLSDYRVREALARELAAQEALKKAQDAAQEQKDEEITFLETVAQMSDDPDVAQKVLAEASELRDAPPPVIAVLDDPAPPEPQSPVVERKRYKGVVTDIGALVRAVSDGRVPLEALAVNRRWLDEQVNAQREEFQLDGCKLVVEASFVRKARRP